MKYFFLLPVTMVLTACGGSGSSENTGRDPLPPPVTTPDVAELEALTSQSGLSLYGDSSITSFDSVGFAITADNAEIASISWTQVSGPSLQILSNRSQTIGFDVPQAGDYMLRASVTLEGANAPITMEHSFTAAESVQANANVRLDHSVVERGSVSLRVNSSLDLEQSTISWEQIAGPEVLDFTPQEDDLFFDVPEVDRDRVVQIRVTVTSPSGQVQSDDSFITIDNTVINENGYFPDNQQVVSTDMFVFNDDSPFKNAVEDCVYNNVLDRTCTFETLPLIGQTTSTPTIEDILDRTLVSHEWMGERFKQYLESSAAGPDMLNLLRGVTAVVISYDVRPSFYWVATGAIYLDADNFWVTPNERDTLNEAPDFRANFGNDLNFIIPWRYVKNNEYYPAGIYPSEQRGMRTFEDLEADISWLMYHELGHANDFFPPNTWNTFSQSSDPLTEFRQNGTNSDILDRSFPLRSDEMHALADVRFAGVDANDVQKTYNGDDLIPFFEPDISPAFYSYLNEREDFATLFERFMMKYRLDASADVALITREDNPNFIVSWGQRDRFNHADIQARVRFAVENVLPEVGDVEAIQASLPAPVLMNSSLSWFDNLVLGQSNSNSVSALSSSTQNNIEVSDQIREFREQELQGLHQDEFKLPSQ
ncbi:hypothetical protein [Glaciecola sp. KUL10]|uniref:hypothetical protein n=1 Tax=Glaciecola sp. (strain KUL10) TaxID=2161813 RepID=UPI000D78BEE5|nr:hypothetical protein [Glaciecola sp. KUL10]GBL03003.1 hypothetical protein KUL10_02800 [Glaciecola sp. KUL10]